MFKEILLNFKLSALKAFIDKESIKFFEQTLNITNDFYENIGLHELLAEAISNSNPQGLLEVKDKRDFFIDRIPKDKLSLIFEAINGEVLNLDSINELHYQGFKRFADERFSEFLNVLSLSSTESSEPKSHNNYKGCITVKPTYGLYPYQIEILQKTFNSIELGSQSRAVIHLPTGAGKTRTAMHIVCRHLMTNPDALVLWLANSDILCAQASSEFDKAWGILGNREVLKGSYYKENTFSLNSIKRGFVVGGIQKLNAYYKVCTDNTVQEFDKRVTLVIFDEAHRALADSYKELVDRFMTNSRKAKLIGLTATPGRVYKDDKPEADPQNLELANLFGNNKITMDVSPLQPMEFLIENNYLADPEFIELKYDDSDLYDIELASNFVDEKDLFKKLSNSKNRNSEIIATVIQEVKENNAKIIIFACDIQHSRNLAFSLCCFGIKAAAVDSKYTSQKEKERIINSYKSGELSVLVNVEMLTTGFDAPETNVAIIARPTESLVLYLQMIGRAIRGNPDLTAKKAKIYTVIDEISEFNNVNRAFKHWNEMWTELDSKEKLCL